MGYDVSYHAVDLRLMNERIVPYLTGRAPFPGDLVARAVELQKVRFRANAWGLGTLGVVGPHELDAGLHVWGRPFFITADHADEVAHIAIRYLNCGEAGVDALALEQLAALDPTLTRHVEPDPEGSLPGDAALAAGFADGLHRLREAADAARRSRRKKIRTPSGNKVNAADLLTSNAQFVLMEFLASLLPGWMQRGYWPTELIDHADMVGHGGFSGNGPLLGTLPAELPQLDWRSDRTITANYEIGGYIAPAEIRPMRHWLADNARALRQVGEHWDDAEGVECALRKCGEALAFADAIGGGFVEATDIYVPMMGQMN